MANPDQSYTPNMTPAPVEQQATITERHHDWPPLHTSFWFSAHTNAADMEGILPLLEQADIYFYENSSPELTQMLQQISSEPPWREESIMDNLFIGGEPVRGSDWQPIIHGLYDSGKVVSSIDLKPDEQHIREGITDITVLPHGGEFEDALLVYEKKIAKAATLQNQREALMVQYFEEEMVRIFDGHPELRNKASVDVLLSIGAYHTTLRRLLSDQGITSDRQFSSMPFTYDYPNELQRTLALGRKPDRQLLVKAYAGNVLNRVVGLSLGSSAVEVPLESRMRYVRRITSNINEDDALALYERFRDNTLTVKYVDAMLDGKGLSRLPRSSRELEPPKQASQILDRQGIDNVGQESQHPNFPENRQGDNRPTRRRRAAWALSRLVRRS